jgi:hypothetical protein
MDSDEEEAEVADQFLNLAIQTKSLKLFTSVQTVWTDFGTRVDRIAYIIMTNHIIIESCFFTNIDKLSRFNVYFVFNTRNCGRNRRWLHCECDKLGGMNQKSEDIFGKQECSLRTTQIGAKFLSVRMFFAKNCEIGRVPQT